MKLRNVENLLPGVSRRMWVHDDGAITDELVQDSTAVLDLNQQFRNGDTPQGDMLKAQGYKHVARIPMVVAEKWFNDYGLWVCNPDHWKEIEEKLLNDRDWSKLRTIEGKV